MSFSNGLMFPGDPSGGAAEVVNCRCALLQRAKWALDEEELEELKQRAEFFGLDKSQQFSEFKNKYLELSDKLSAGADDTKEAAADVRDKLDKILSRSTTPIKQGFSAFPKTDPLYKNVKNVIPDGDMFDVAMHGSPTAVAFGARETNMSPRLLLASIIRHNPDYHGQEVRLLSCNTGVRLNDGYCFAEELANALGVTVYAPNDLLYIYPSGKIQIGNLDSSKFEKFVPNERRRIK